MADTLRLIRDGKILPNQLNTGKIDELVRAAKSIYLKKSEAGMDLGTRVHAWIEAYYRHKILGGSLSPLVTDLAEDMKKPVEAFLKWDNEFQFQPIHIEHMVWSCGIALPGGDAEDEKYRGYAGSYDGYGMTTRGITLKDVKVATGHWPEGVLQLGGYSYAQAEMTGEIAEQHLILRLDKITGMPDPKWYTKNEINQGIKRFLALTIYWWETFKNMDVSKLAELNGGKK
jgi:hypothetical protein